MQFEKSYTARGFELLTFTDRYDELCDIQRSSLATEDAIWLGTHSPNPKIMASKTTEGGTGWVDYPLSEDVPINHRMHLTRNQSISLALKLLKFGLFNKI
jgi:hypothetical protein